MCMLDYELLYTQTEKSPELSVSNNGVLGFSIHSDSREPLLSQSMHIFSLRQKHKEVCTG